MRPSDFVGDAAALEPRVKRPASRAGRGDWPRHPDCGARSEDDWLRWACLTWTTTFASSTCSRDCASFIAVASEWLAVINQ